MTDVTTDDPTICSLVLMPQAITSSMTVSITYNIHFASSDPDHPDDIVYSNNSGTARLDSAVSITSWEPGKRYIYNISAGFERIEFESAVTTDWSVGNDNIPVS